MINKKVLNYLEKNKIAFALVDHKKIFTAHDLAQTLKEDFRKIAKTLLVKADKKYLIVIIPAHYRLDFKKLKAALKAKKIEIPSEKVMAKVLNVKVGGITPFGALHNLETWADKNLLKTQETILNAGSFTQSLRMKVKDFLKLEEVKLGNFVESAGYKLAKPKKIKKASKKKVPILSASRRGGTVAKTTKKPAGKSGKKFTRGGSGLAGKAKKANKKKK